jgi:hypothetical protein
LSFEETLGPPPQAAVSWAARATATRVVQRRVGREGLVMVLWSRIPKNRE